MKTEAIKSLIRACEMLENTISGVLSDDGLEDKAVIERAKVELADMEAEIAATKQGECGHNYDRREWDGCPVCAMKDGVGIRIANLESEIQMQEADGTT